MTSADFLTRIPTPHDVSSTMAPVRISPGMTHPSSRLYLSDIRHSVPCKFRALTILVASPRCNASYPLPVRQASALPSASSRFAVTRDTLAVQLTLPLAGRVEDFHLQVSAPCRAHQKKGPEIIRALQFGGPNEDRTHDLRIANAALSQLSYRPYVRNYSLSLTAICKCMRGRCTLQTIGNGSPVQTVRQRLNDDLIQPFSIEFA